MQPMMFSIERRLILWYFLYNIFPSQEEWIELPKVNPSSKAKRKIYSLPPESAPNKSSISLDMNMERILMQVHKTLAAEGRSKINRKEYFLKKLQSQLLSEIWGESNNLWSRTGIEARNNGNVMAFPSLEGALMTISFLTFAVFLIKIVKQCLQGLQPAGSVVGIELPATMIAPAKVIKHKRSINQINIDKALQCTKLSQFNATRVCSPFTEN